MFLYRTTIYIVISHSCTSNQTKQQVSLFIVSFLLPSHSSWGRRTYSVCVRKNPAITKLIHVEQTDSLPNQTVQSSVCTISEAAMSIYPTQNQRTFSLVILWNSQRNKHSSHHNDLDLIIIRTVNCVGYRCMRQKYLRQQIYDL